MKEYLIKRNEQMRITYKRLLSCMPWKDAVRECSQKYSLSFHTVQAIVHHKGRYSLKKNGCANSEPPSVVEYGD